MDEENNNIYDDYFKHVKSMIFRYRLFHPNALKVFLAICTAMKVRIKEIRNDPEHLPHTSFLNVRVSVEDIKDNLMNTHLEHININELESIINKYLVYNNYDFVSYSDGEDTITGKPCVMYRLTVNYVKLPKYMKKFLCNKSKKILKLNNPLM